MVLEESGNPLVYKKVPVPQPLEGQILLRILACGICRTDLHILDGELTHPSLPLIMGHEIVGSVVKKGIHADRFALDQVVGVPWLGYTDGTCTYCRKGAENLCDNPGFTGYTLNGGYAQYAVADERFCFALPQNIPAANAAPLLCAGLIGYRSYRMAGENSLRLGLFGFGAAAHILCQIAVHQQKEVYAFTRPGDTLSQQFARELGACWAGDSDTLPPKKLDAAIIFAPIGDLIPQALLAVDKGGVVVTGGIHMSRIPAFPYEYLWEERVIRSVANLTRQDGLEFFELLSRIGVNTQIQTFKLEEANLALTSLRKGQVKGAAVLIPS